MKKLKIFDDKMTVSRGFSRIHKHENSSYLTGEVATPQGFTSVYTQGDNVHFPHTRIDFVHKGVLYMRNIEKRYSAQYLVTLAKRFAKEIVNK